MPMPFAGASLISHVASTGEHHDSAVDVKKLHDVKKAIYSRVAALAQSAWQRQPFEHMSCFPEG